MTDGPHSDRPSPPLPPPSGYVPPGSPPPYHYYGPHPYAVAPPGNGIAIAAGVCGIIAVVPSWIPIFNIVSIILGILAVVFGFIGNSRANRLGGAGRGMSVTGIVCGIVAIVISILFLIIFAVSVHTVTTVPDFPTFTPFPT
ncbi:MAG: DUF4190 domain-containing protein [Candidatus Dormibacteraeota bacterium]|nr:DUF4190 domain-containing protein [Candidatus Dormibacteraeota bacterium]MBV9525950.1 DUF4190 domain-containing protein [Candidatus Dormibacteraeota bacterium]